MADPFPPMADLVPHRESMRLLSSVLEHSEHRTVCAVEVGTDSPFLTGDGGVPVFVGVEYLAQGVAAHAGLRGWVKGEPPRVGFLIGSRRLDVRGHADFRVGQRLIVEVVRAWGEEELAMFSCRLVDADSQVVVLEGTLSVVQPRSLERFGVRPR